MITDKNTVIKIESTLGGRFCFNIKADAEIKKATLTVKDNCGEVFYSEYKVFCTVAMLEGEINCPKLWDLQFPNLYYYDLTIEYGTCFEKISSHFAFRELKIKGTSILLNKKPIFIKGYIRGAAAHEHQNDANLSEREFYAKNITNAKKLGFNFVRFHSVVPSDCFFDVADELGILVHIELRPEFDEYNNLEEMINSRGVSISETYVKGVIDSLFNHPSLAEYCLGNELRDLNESRQASKLGKFIKKEDGSRFYIDTCAWGAFDRKGVDINIQHMGYYFPIYNHSNMFASTENLLVCNDSNGESLVKQCENSKINYNVTFKTPLIAHEVCHYTALRDVYNLRDKFIKNKKECPWWINSQIKMIEEKGLTSEYGNLYKASKYFQFLCWKVCLEELRLSPLLNGYHFLQLADTDKYENSNGLLDCFDDICVDADKFKCFNGDDIVVSKLPKYIYDDGETFSFPVYASLYGNKNRKIGKLDYKLVDSDGVKVAYGSLPKIDIKNSGTYKICDITINLPKFNFSKQYCLEISLIEGKDKICNNSWNIWSFNKDGFNYSYKDFTSVVEKDYVITSDIEKSLQYLKRGYKVCLVYRSDFTRHVANKNMEYPKLSFKATWNRFKPVIWDRGTNYGGFCNSELLNKFGFNTDKLYDINYSIISEDCDKIILDDFPVKVDSLITGIDKFTRDRFDAYSYCFNLPELMPDRCLRNFSYLFEVAVGTGKLLVCGLNLTGIDKGEPSSVAMAKFILNYIKSEDFNPKNKIDADLLYNYLKNCAKQPVKERMMTQFWELDDTPVESKEYWEESKEYLS